MHVSGDFWRLSLVGLFICQSFTLLAAPTVENQVIVKLKQDVRTTSLLGFFSKQKNIDPILKKYKIKNIDPFKAKKNRSFLSGATTLSRLEKNERYLINFEENIDPHLVSKEFEASSDVEYAQPNFIYDTLSVPNDPLYESQQEDDLSLVQMNSVWDLSLGSDEIIIAVVDTGVNINHEDLIDNIWINEGEIADNDIDDDNNGFIDDVNGWNFVTSDNNVVDVKLTDKSTDKYGHGTLVAGIAAGRTGNGIGTAGICGRCRIMPVRSGGSSFTSSDISKGLAYALNNGAHIVNMSFGGHLKKDQDDKTIREEVDKLEIANIIAIAAAGNKKRDILTDSNGVFFPAAYDNVITVSGSLNNGSFASAWEGTSGGSNFGDPVDIMAPSERIYGTYIATNKKNNIYANNTGTSFAAPIVAGALGLLMSTFPEATTTNVIEAIYNSAKELEATGKDPKTGHGMIQIYDALAALDSAAPKITHETLPQQNIGDVITITAQVDEESLYTATLFYKLKEGSNALSSDYLSEPMTQNGNSISYSFPILEGSISDIEYYIKVTDSLNKESLAPDSAPNIPNFVVFEDLVGPTIQSSAIDQDYFTPQDPITITIFDNVAIDLDSIKVTLTYSGGSIDIPIITSQASGIIKDHELTLDLSDIDFQANESIGIEVTALDSKGQSTTFTQQLFQTDSLKIFGPAGESSPIVNVPNPFNPTQESTTIWYQLSTNADVEIRIFSLDLKTVKTFSRSMSPGPTDEQDIWDGRDDSGNLVPNGVYPFIIKASNGSDTVIKKGKIVVLR